MTNAAVAAFPDRRRDERAAAEILAVAGISWARLKDERDRAICVLAEAGWTTREIAAVFEIGQTTVVTVLNRNGSKSTDPRGGAREHKPAEPGDDEPTPEAARDQAFAEADVINAFRALVQQAITRKNITSMTPKARGLLADTLRNALKTIEETE